MMETLNVGREGGTAPPVFRRRRSFSDPPMPHARLMEYSNYSNPVEDGNAPQRTQLSSDLTLKKDTEEEVGVEGAEWNFEKFISRVTEKVTEDDWEVESIFEFEEPSWGERKDSLQKKDKDKDKTTESEKDSERDRKNYEEGGDKKVTDREEAGKDVTNSKEKYKVATSQSRQKDKKSSREEKKVLKGSKDKKTSSDSRMLKEKKKKRKPRARTGPEESIAPDERGRGRWATNPEEKDEGNGKDESSRGNEEKETTRMKPGTWSFNSEGEASIEDGEVKSPQLAADEEMGKDTLTPLRFHRLNLTRKRSSTSIIPDTFFQLQKQIEMATRAAQQEEHSQAICSLNLALPLSSSPTMHELMNSVSTEQTSHEESKNPDSPRAVGRRVDRSLQAQAKLSKILGAGVPQVGGGDHLLKQDELKTIKSFEKPTHRKSKSTSWKSHIKKKDLQQNTEDSSTFPLHNSPPHSGSTVGIIPLHPIHQSWFKAFQKKFKLKDEENSNNGSMMASAYRIRRKSVEERGQWQVTRQDWNTEKASEAMGGGPQVGGGAIVISAPSHPRHKLHVDFDFIWTGEDPVAQFTLAAKLGQGYTLSCPHTILITKFLFCSAFGKVYKANHKDTGFVMAIKCINMEGTSLKESKQILKEIDVLKKCRSEHVVSYFGSCLRKNCLWVIYLSNLIIFFEVPSSS